MPYPDRHIGMFKIDVRPTEDGASQKVKVTLQIHHNGLFWVSSAKLFHDDGRVTDLKVSERVPNHLSPKRLQAAVRVNCQLLVLLY